MLQNIQNIQKREGKKPKTQQKTTFHLLQSSTHFKNAASIASNLQREGYIVTRSGSDSGTRAEKEEVGKKVSFLLDYIYHVPVYIDNVFVYLCIHMYYHS